MKASRFIIPLLVLVLAFSISCAAEELAVEEKPERVEEKAVVEEPVEEEVTEELVAEEDPERSQVKPSSDKNEIPEDYPREFCPIYEPSAIIGKEQINVEDKVNYIIEFVSKDEINTIEAFYLELDYVTDELSMGDVISQIYLENKSEKICGIINLEPVERTDFASYASEGYKIYGSIAVDIGW